MRTTIVRDGETIYDIAIREFGRVDMVDYILFYNPAMAGYVELPQGAVIYLPSQEDARPPAQEFTRDFYEVKQEQTPQQLPETIILPSFTWSPEQGTRTVVVREGETIYDIAIRHLGSVSFVPVIYAFNPALQDMVELTQGTAIILPANITPTVTPDAVRNEALPVFIPQQPAPAPPAPGTLYHPQLLERDKPDQHPASSISLNASEYTGNLDETVTDVEKLAEAFDQYSPPTGIPEPADSEDVYARAPGSWVATITKAAFNAFAEAWNLAWGTLKQMAFMDKPASDGKTYGMKNGEWAEVTGGGSGSIPISPSAVTRGINGLITKNIVTISEGVRIETRCNYVSGLMTFFEIKNDVSGEWKRVTINYELGLYKDKTVEIITAWTI